RSQLQRMAPARVKEVTAPSKDLLREVVWSRVGAHCGHAANVHDSVFFSWSTRILRADQSGWGRIPGMSSAQGEAESPEQCGRKNVVLRNRGVLVAAEAKCPELRIRLRICLVRVINRMPAKQAIGRRKDVVHASLAVIVARRLCKRERVLISG